MDAASVLCQDKSWLQETTQQIDTTILEKEDWSEGRTETQRAELTALKDYSQALKPNNNNNKKPICPHESQNCYGQWDSDGQTPF